MKLGRPLAYFLAAALLLGAASPLAAQDEADSHAAPAAEEKYDIITPHITDGNHMEVPWPLPPFFKEVTLPHWEPIHIGGFALDPEWCLM